MRRPFALDAEVARRGDDAAAEVVLPEPVDDHARQQLAGAVVDVGDPVRPATAGGTTSASPAAARPASASPRPGRSASAPGGSPASATPSFWLGSPRLRKCVCSRKSPPCVCSRIAGTPSLQIIAFIVVDGGAFRRMLLHLRAFRSRHCGSVLRYHAKQRGPFRVRRLMRSGRRPARVSAACASAGTASPSRPTGRRSRRHRQPRPADVVAGVVVELERERQHRAAVEADSALRLEDGRVILAELRIDRPAGFLVAVDGRRDRQALLLERRLADSPASPAPACPLAVQRRRRDAEVAEGEVAVGRPARSALHQRRIGQRLQPHGRDALQRRRAP